MNIPEALLEDADPKKGSHQGRGPDGKAAAGEARETEGELNLSSGGSRGAGLRSCALRALIAPGTAIGFRPVFEPRIRLGELTEVLSEGYRPEAIGKASL